MVLPGNRCVQGRQTGVRCSLVPFLACQLFSVSAFSPLQGVERGEGVEVAALAVEGDFFVPALSEGVAEGGAV